jgi:hypothetical protein
MIHLRVLRAIAFLLFWLFWLPVARCRAVSPEMIQFRYPRPGTLSSFSGDARDPVAGQEDA